MCLCLFQDEQDQLIDELSSKYYKSSTINWYKISICRLLFSESLDISKDQLKSKYSKRLDFS